MRLVSGVSLVEPRAPLKTLDVASSRKDANDLMLGIALMDPPKEPIGGGASNKFTPEQEKKLEEVALKFYLAIKAAVKTGAWEPVISAYDKAIEIYAGTAIDPSEFRKDFSARSQKKAIELDGESGQETCCRGEIVIAATEAFFKDY